MADTFRSFVMLTNAKVTGKYRYRDIFQLLPAPVHFPHASYTEAHHPCLLEIKYDFTPESSKRMDDQTETPEWIQRTNHEEKLIHEIKSLFGVFSLSKFVDLQTNHSWTIGRHDDSATRPEWRQLSDFARGHPSEIGEFTNSPASQMDETNTKESYNFGVRFSGSNFSVPDLLSSILDAYYDLDQDSKIATLKSASLFNNAIRIKPISRSISFACFVSSLESLISHIHKNKSKKVERCGTCKTPLYKVTEKFKDFLEKYGSDSDELIKFYGKAYDQRSKILHSGAIFPGEYIPIDWEEYDSKADQMNSGINRICRIAFANWILDSQRHSYPS